MNREQILNSARWRTCQPDLADWPPLFIRDLSGRDEQRIESARAKDGALSPRVLARTIIGSVCNESGDLILRWYDEAALLRLPSRMLKSLACAIAKHSSGRGEQRR